MVSVLYFLAAIAVVGLPPLSGFLGKLLILDAVRPSAHGAWIWAFVLGTSVISLLGFARAGITLFWESAEAPDASHCKVPVHPDLTLGVTAALVAGLLGITVMAGPVTAYLGAASTQLFDTSAYLGAVLGAR